MRKFAANVDSSSLSCVNHCEPSLSDGERAVNNFLLPELFNKQINWIWHEV